MRRGSPNTTSLAASILALLVSLAWMEAALGGDFGGNVRAAFVPRGLAARGGVSRQTSLLEMIHVRGGASRAMKDDEDEEYDEEDEEEEEEEEEESKLDAKLSASAVKSSSKTKAKIQAQKAAKIKEAVNTKLTDTKSKAATKKKKSSSGGLLKIPYIMRALLNPLTAFAMTRAFWVSLFNLDYPPKDSSQDLRSSIEEKNRNSGPSTFKKPKRKMKRGQAKTLSDLPQLST